MSGWPEPEVENNLSRAHELSKQFGETKDLFAILYGRWCVYNSRGIYDTALPLAQKMIDAGEKVEDIGLIIMGHAAACITYAYTADFVGAQRSMDKVVELYDFDQHAYLVELANHDPKCLVLGWASHWLWMQGRLEEARRVSFEQLDLARKLNHPFNLMFSLCAGAGSFNYTREPDEYLSWMDKALKTGVEQGIPIAEMFLVPFFRGHGLVSFGRYQEGFDELKKGTDIWVAIGARCVPPALWVSMSEALGHIDRVEDGLVRIEKTPVLIEELGERWHEPEAHRIKGELLLRADNHNHRDAEICFLNGIRVAQELESKSWELRSSMSLARLWKHQNKLDEAHDLLATIYDWFTEGFDTADLKDAKALLDELGQA